MGFRVKFETKEQLVKGLQALKDIGALGTEICVGTYLPDSMSVDDLLTGRVATAFGHLRIAHKDSDVMEFSIGREPKNVIEDFPHLIGKNGVCVGLTTYYDIRNKDVYGRTVPFEDMIEETLKLIDENTEAKK